MLSSIQRSTSIPMPTPAPPEPPQTSPQPQDVYNGIDSMLVDTCQGLKTGSVDRKAVENVSRQQADSFKQTLIGVKSAPQLATEAHDAAMMALVSGLLCGALDGAIALTCAAAPPPAPTPGPAPAPPSAAPNIDMGKAFDEVLKELKEDLAKTGQELLKSGEKSLAETSKFGKDLGEMYVQRAEKCTADQGASRSDYQTMLVSGFGIGYSIGVTDAAYVTLTGTAPGQNGTQPAPAPPQPPPGQSHQPA